MRIVVWGINYAPEVTGIGPHNTALSEFLKRNGHDVEMLTSFCYYPAWQKLPEDAGRIYRTDNTNGVPVHRCWHYVPNKPGNRHRILHELSFVTMSALRFLTLQRPDLVIVVSPPLLLGPAAWLVGILKRTRYIFHVQDLQPDGALGLGMLSQSSFARILYKIESLAYAKAWRVSGISPGMLEAFFKKRVPGEKLIHFPNTIALPKGGETPERGIFRARHGLAADDFLALHSGNIGMKHGLEIVVEAASLLKDKRVKIVICGQGAASSYLSEAIAQSGLKNILQLALQPDLEYRQMLADVDACLVTQQKGSGRSFLPSKLLPALAHGKPVMTVADNDSELSRVMDEGGFGVRTSPDDPEALAHELDRLASAPEECESLGTNGKKFVAQFEREKVFRQFTETVFQDLKNQRLGGS